MKTLSTSFTLGKASDPHGANPKHNSREFLADNIDTSRTDDNIEYVYQDVEDAYAELFAESLQEYNAKQKRNDRKIENYYEHIKNGSREEAFYEVVVQFGCAKSCPVGSEGGDIATKMLDEYMKSFQARNPNLKIFSAHLHLDEATPHLHIDFIPFYTKGKKLGLSKGVSMRAALEEQGFSNKHVKANSLIAWQDSEREIMDELLTRHNFSRKVKNANYAHMTVEEYKEKQDLKKILSVPQENLTPEQLAEENLRRLEIENSMLRTENKKLENEKHSPWKSFYYTHTEKQSLVQAELDRLQIPYRETENGFQAQECYVEKIRAIEKSVKPPQENYREKLRRFLDGHVLAVRSYDDIILCLQKAGYEVKQNKYISVKPPNAERFIRLKSIGEEYSEHGLKSRIYHNQMFMRENAEKIKAAETKNRDSFDTLTFNMVKIYTTAVLQGYIPLKRRNKKKPFSWTNCEDLDKLSDLNKKLNAGMTVEGLRNNLATLEKSVAEKESVHYELKCSWVESDNLYEAAKRCFELRYQNPADWKLMEVHGLSSYNYKSLIQEIEQRKAKYDDYEKSVLLPEQKKLKSADELLTTATKVMGGTWVQWLADEEKHRRQAKDIPNGLQNADDNSLSLPVKGNVPKR